MAKSEQSAAAPKLAGKGAAAYLDITDDRRAAAEANAAMLVAAAQRVADTLPLQADVDDFRRVLVSEVK